jgi:arylsulfatase A
LVASLPGQNKPNIILIVADDLGERDLAVYGNDFTETPHLDQLAASGVLFTNGYASGPICSPTRASILTGSAPARIGMTEHLRGTPSVPNSQEEIPPENVRSIPGSFPILARMLRDQGYTSAHIGKAHFGGNPANFGYDLVFSGGALPSTYYYPFFNGNPFPELTAYAQPGDYITDVLTNRSLDFIEDQQQEGPFFLHLNYYAPHVPIEGREDLVTKYQNKAAENPDHVFPEPEYAAMVEGIDENVGRIIEKLQDLEILDNTLIVFTSDNGALHVQEVPQFAQHTPPTDNYPLRAGKGHLYEGGTRVPFIFAGLDVPSGLEVHTPIISSDLFNTFAQLSGSEQRTPNGVDVSPLTRGEAFEERYLFWHFPHYSPQRGKPMSSIRAGKYKLLKWAERDRIELFDLETDPSESCNLVLDQPQLADSLENALESWLSSVNARRTTSNPNYDDRPDRAKESFDHRLDTKLESRNEGSGWVYNWTRRSGESLYVRANSLEYASIRSAGGHLELKHSGGEAIRYSRTFLNPFSESRSLWCSFLLEPGSEGAFSMTWDGSDERPVFSLEKPSDSPSFSMQHPSGTAQEFQMPADQTNWVVVQVTGFAATDSVMVWVNPPADRLPVPEESDALLTDLDFSNGLEGISLEVGDGFEGALDEWTLGFGLRRPFAHAYQPEFSAYNVHEPFTYPIGESILGKGIDTLGWVGPWENAGNLQGNSITLESGNLRSEDQSGTAPSYVKLSYTQNNSQIRIDRQLADPIVSDGSTYWISYWVSTLPTTANGNVANLNLVNSAISDAAGHRLSIGRLYGTGQLGMITPSNGSRSNTNLSDQGLRHILVRIRTVRGMENDTVHLWVNPDISQAPALDQANAMLTTPVLKEGIDEIRLRVEGAGGGQTPLIVSFDHLRIGRSWEIAQLLDEQLMTSSSNPEESNGFLRVFPNPARNELFLECSRPGSYLIEMYTLSGKKVDEVEMDWEAGGTQNIRLDDLKAGLYLVNVVEKKSGIRMIKRVLIH